MDSSRFLYSGIIIVHRARKCKPFRSSTSKRRLRRVGCLKEADQISSFMSPGLTQLILRSTRSKTKREQGGKNETDQHEAGPIHRGDRRFRAGGDVREPAHVNADLADETAGAHAA